MAQPIGYSPEHFAAQAMNYLVVAQKYETCPQIAQYLNAKSRVEDLTKNAIEGGNQIGSVVKIFEEQAVRDPKGKMWGLDLKASRYFREIVEKFLSPTGIDAEKEPKPTLTPEEYLIQQGQKDWQKKVNQYIAILNKYGLLEKFQSQFPQQADLALMAELPAATRLFEDTKLVISQEPYKSLVKQYQAARKGIPGTPEQGLFPSIKQHKKEMLADLGSFKVALENAQGFTSIDQKVRDKALKEIFSKIQKK